MEIEEIKKLSAELTEMSSEEKYKWIIQTPLKSEFRLFLDNDSMGMCFYADEECDYVVGFQGAFLGTGPGLKYLLEELGIRFEFA